MCVLLVMITWAVDLVAFPMKKKIIPEALLLILFEPLKAVIFPNVGNRTM